MKSIQFVQVTPEELQCAILKGIEEKLDELKTNFAPKQPPEYLNRNEVAKLLKVNVSTIFNWQKKGILNRYAIGNKILFKRQEIEDCLIPLK